MPKGKKADKPNYNFIDSNTVYNDVLTAFDNGLKSMGYSSFGIRYDIPNKPTYITHNEVNYLFRQIANQLFKTDKPLYNNQKSKINYDDDVLLSNIGDAFIDICQKLNKSLGLMSFAWLCGIPYETLARWLREGESNPKRYHVLKSIQESHKAMHISLLNESAVGALAVANNDVETGLEWTKQQAILQASNTVFLLPSERLDKLKLPKNDND